MIIEINQDIENYKESVVLGLTARQLIFSVASIVAGGAVVLLLHPYVGLTVAAYLAVPVVAPIALGGFYTYQGMNFYEVVGRRIHFAFFNRPIGYVSTEGEREIEAYAEEKQMKQKGRKG